MGVYDEPTALFAKHFVRSSCLCSVECGCGRVHFVTARGHGDYNEGELDRLKELAEAKPDKYIACENFDHIDVVYLSGDCTVVDCPCDRAVRVAAFLFNHADECASLLVDLLGRRATAFSEKERECRKLTTKLSLWPTVTVE